MVAVANTCFVEQRVCVLKLTFLGVYGMIILYKSTEL